MASGGTSNRVFARISALFFATRAALAICLVHIHAGNAKDVDARRLDDVDSVDAEAGTGTGRRRCLVHRHVGDDDGSDDAAVPGVGVVALLASRLGRRAGPLRGVSHTGHPRLPLVWALIRLAVFPVGVATAEIGLEQPVLARAVLSRLGWPSGSPAHFIDLKSE